MIRWDKHEALVFLESDHDGPGLGSGNWNSPPGVLRFAGPFTQMPNIDE